MPQINENKKFIEGRAFENAVCKMLAILSRTNVFTELVINE